MSESRTEEFEEPPDVIDLLDELEDITEVVEDEDAKREVEEAIEVAKRVQYPSVFGRVISGFGIADAAEAFVGSVVFGIPMIIEGGTLEVGEFIARRPVFHFGTLAFGVAVVFGLIYVADIQRVEVVDPLFGFLPRRLVGVLGVAFLTSFALMTGWGRVDWSTPRIAFGQISFVFVGMAIGGALGDILPGS